MKKTILLSSLLLVMGVFALTMIHPSQIAKATGIECIGPGPCVIPVSPPPSCQDGGTPIGPISDAINTTSIGQRAVLKIGPANNCNTVITSFDASLVGAESSVQIGTFTVWQTPDSTCGYPDNNILYMQDLAIGPNHPADHISAGMASPAVLAQDISSQIVCVGFYSSTTGAWEKFNVTYAYR
jgi:hypothetical protein